MFLNIDDFFPPQELKLSKTFYAIIGIIFTNYIVIKYAIINLDLMHLFKLQHICVGHKYLLNTTMTVIHLQLV